MTTGGGIPVIRYDLAHFGVVTSVTSPTVFTIAGLAGFGLGAFVGYSVYVLRKGTGTGLAPQGEAQIVTAYVNSSGQFTITAGFTVPIAVGDEILAVHPAIAGALLVGPSAAQITRLAGAVTAGVHVHTDDAFWQAVFAFNPLTNRRKVHSIWMDFVNFAGALQTVTYRLSYMVDGATYRIFDTNAPAPWLLASEDGVIIAVNAAIDHPFLLEIQKTVAEGAPRNVPYEVLYEEMS
jgi:hypothetical protein